MNEKPIFMITRLDCTSVPPSIADDEKKVIEQMRVTDVEWVSGDCCYAKAEDAKRVAKVLQELLPEYKFAVVATFAGKAVRFA